MKNLRKEGREGEKNQMCGLANLLFIAKKTLRKEGGREGGEKN